MGLVAFPRRAPKLALLAFVVAANPVSSQVLKWEVDDSQSGSELGTRIASVGDINGDGFEDVLVGLPGKDIGGLVDAGEARIHSGLDGSVLFATQGTKAGVQAGYSVAGLRNSTNDFLVGAPGANEDTGQVVMFGGSSLLVKWTGYGKTKPFPSRFGHAVTVGRSASGDFQWFAVSAPHEYVGTTVDSQTLTGAAYRFYGSIGFPPEPILSTTANDDFGLALGASDVNGDGTADVIVAEPGFDGPLWVDQGRVRVYDSDDYTLLQSEAGSAPGVRFGETVSGAGDVDLDGREDLLVGSPQEHTSAPQAGAVRVLAGLSGNLLHQQNGTVAGARLGASVSCLGDVNQDGYPEYAIGVPGGDLSSSRGLVRVHSGRTHLLAHQLDAPIFGNEYGAGCTFAGDVNNDGIPDLAVGDPVYLESEGRVWVYAMKLAYFRNYGYGLSGTLGVPKILLSGPPQVGSSNEIVLTNSSGRDTIGFLIVGNDAVDLPFKGGQWLVSPTILQRLPIPADGLEGILEIPDDPVLVCASLFLQLLLLDGDAIQGVAMSSGLELKYGF